MGVINVRKQHLAILVSHVLVHIIFGVACFVEVAQKIVIIEN